MGPIWGRQDPGGSHVGPMNFAIWVVLGWNMRRLCASKPLKYDTFGSIHKRKQTNRVTVASCYNKSLATRLFVSDGLPPQSADDVECVICHDFAMLWYFHGIRFLGCYFAAPFSPKANIAKAPGISVRNIDKIYHVRQNYIDHCPLSTCSNSISRFQCRDSILRSFETHNFIKKADESLQVLSINFNRGYTYICVPILIVTSLSNCSTHTPIYERLTQTVDSGYNVALRHDIAYRIYMT